ncbi:MAG TPA: hypothetical protein VJQ57_13810 [Acidimicrobiia bacterium]|nr:hypothetical protein [Acidimicrobiia bacterium]
MSENPFDLFGPFPRHEILMSATVEVNGTKLRVQMSIARELWESGSHYREALKQDILERLGREVFKELDPEIKVREI